MRIGITIGVVGPTLQAQLDVASRAEAATFTTIASLEAGYDAFAVTAAAVNATTTARLLTGVATWVRPPVTTARAAGTMQALSDGRFELGLGTMPAAWNRDFYGIEATRPLSRLREYVAVIRGACEATEPFDHDGDHFQVRGYLPLVPPTGRTPAIHLAATRPGMAHLAGEIGDGVIYNFVHTPQWISDVLEPAVAAGEHAADRQRPVERGVMLVCSIDDDEQMALDRVRHSFARHIDIPYFQEIAAASGFDLAAAKELIAAGRRAEAVSAVPDDLLRSMAAVGSPETCRRRVEAFAGLVDWVQLTPPRHVPVSDIQAGFDALIATFS